MKKIYMFVLLFFLSGCNDNTLELTGNNENNLQALKTYVPVGTPKNSAIDKMKKVGFQIEHRQNNRIFFNKLSSGMIVRKRWQVELIFSSEGKVERYKIHDGLIGP